MSAKKHKAIREVAKAIALGMDERAVELLIRQRGLALPKPKDVRRAFRLAATKR